jgi:hypothetical protein
MKPNTARNAIKGIDFTTHTGPIALSLLAVTASLPREPFAGLLDCGAADHPDTLSPRERESE